MSLIQLSSSQIVGGSQGSDATQTNLGNSGCQFTNRLNSVLKIPPNAQIALSQAVFTTQQQQNNVISDNSGTDDMNEAALALFQGGNGTVDKFGTYLDNLKINENQKNFSPCDIPMVCYAPKLKNVTLLSFWEETLKRLNLTATPSLQRGFQVSEQVNSTTGTIKFTFNNTYNTVEYDTTTSPPNQAQVAYNKDTLWLNNDNFRDMVNGSQPKSVKLNPKTGLHAIESIQFEAAGAAPKDTVAWGKRQGMGKTSNNGVSDANGFIEMDYFKGATQGGVGGIHQNSGVPLAARIGPDAGRRTFSFGLDRWESDKINAELQKLTDNLSDSNPFVDAAGLHAQSLFTAVHSGSLPAPTPTDLAGYAYPLALLRQGVIKPWICADYFFVTLPKIDVETALADLDVDNPKFNYMEQTPQKEPAPQHLAIFGVERGQKLLFTDQLPKGANAPIPQEWTDGLKEYPTRLVCLACGDRMAQIMYGVPYSGWLDPENVPLAGDTPAQKNRRFMALDAFSGPGGGAPNEVSAVVSNSGMFSLYDDLDDPFPDNTCMRGLKITNKANKIVFERLYYAGNFDPAVKMKSIQIAATRQLPTNIFNPDTWIKEWAEEAVTTPDVIKAVEGFVNISVYPLQSRFGIGGLQGDLITSPALVPVIRPDISSVANSVKSQSNVEDLVSGQVLGVSQPSGKKLILKGSLNEAKVQAYVTKDMIIPNCLWNRDFYDNVTPIINYYPLLNDPTKEFVSTNRRPSHNGLSEDATDPNKPIYSVASNTSIVLGNSNIFNTKGKLYLPVPKPVNPFLQPNITKLCQGPTVVFLDGTTNTPNYQIPEGSYETAVGPLNPVGFGLYVHLEDLPNTSVMGSMNQLQTKLVALINKYDLITVLNDSSTSGILNKSLTWNAHELLFVKLNNPAPIEISQLSIKLTDRFMNLAEQVKNTQLIFYMIGDEFPIPIKQIIRMP